MRAAYRSRTRCRWRLTTGRVLFVASSGVGGRLYADGEPMFCRGAMMLRTDQAAYNYSAFPNRNKSGVLERIGAARWRRSLPFPRFEPTRYVVDIVPAS